MEGTEKITVRIFKSITMVHEASMVLLEVRHTHIHYSPFEQRCCDFLQPLLFMNAASVLCLKQNVQIYFKQELTDWRKINFASYLSSC